MRGNMQVVTDLCLKHGFIPGTARIVSPKTSMLNLVTAKLGIAIIPERMTSLTINGQGISYVPLSDSDAKSTCSLIIPTQPTRLAEIFADMVLSDSRIDTTG